MRQPSGRATYFPHVDGLRAIAIVSVVVYHLNAAWLPGGFSGVDIFFVISGFIVSASIGSVEPMSLSRFVTFFYARRLQRIAPALLVCLVATSVATALLIPSAWLSMTHQTTGIYAFFGLSNLVLARTSNDYFSPTAEFNPYTHTWSLGVEEQFYFAFPLLFLAWTCRGRGRHVAIGLFAAAFFASLAWSAWLGVTDRTSAFYLITSRFWQLAAGVLLFQLMTLAGRRFDTAEQASPKWCGAAALASLVVMGYGLIASKPDAFPFPGSIPTVLGTLGLLGFLHGAGGGNPLARVLASRPVLFVGRISYSLYLWHWPVFVLFRWTVGLEAPRDQAAALVIASALAAASYYGVESPVRRLPALRRLPRYAVVAAGVAMVGASAWLATEINAAQSRISISTVARHARDWYPEAADIEAAGAGCTVKITDTPVGPGRLITYAPQACEARPNAPRVFAIGDSHTIGYASMFKGYATQAGAPVFVYDNGGCPFLSLQPWREESVGCRAARSAALDDMLNKIRAGDAVFLASLRLPRFAEQFMRYPDAQVQATLFSEGAIDARAKAAAEARSVLRRFQAKGARVILEAPKPIFRSPAYRCAEAYNRTNPSCRDGTEIDRAEMQQLREPVVDALRYLAASVSGVSVWDPFPVLCPRGARCSAYSNGRPLFFDADHVSGYGNLRLLPSFLACMADGCRGDSSAREEPPVLPRVVGATYTRKIYTLYIGCLGRPPAPAGLTYYGELMSRSGGNFLIVADDLWNSAEARTLYANASIDDAVRAVFRNLFGRDARPAGVEYWAGQIRSGAVAPFELASAIAANAAAADRSVLEARQRAAMSFFNAIDTPTKASAYAANVGFGRSYLSCIVAGARTRLATRTADAVGALMAGQAYRCH